MSKTTTAAPPTPCNCWEVTNARLEEKGFQLSKTLSALSFGGPGGLTVTRQLPIQRIGGVKLKRSDPQSMQINHCPFCGTAYPKPAQD